MTILTQNSVLISFFKENPIAYLFLICGLGYGIGSIKFRNWPRLGSAAVIFVGLVFGALEPQIQLSPFVGSLGLVFLMYSVGSQSANGITGALSGKNFKLLVCALSVIVAAAGLVIFCSFLIPQTGGYRAGIFAGILSNSTGLAAIEDALSVGGAHGSALQPPIVAFSLAYPLSLFIPVLVVPLAEWFSKINLKAEAQADPEYVHSHLPLRNGIVKISNLAIVGRRLDSLIADAKSHPIVFGELIRGGHSDLAAGKTAVALGDEISVVGTQIDIDAFAKFVGELKPFEATTANPFELRRIIVSKPDVTSIPLHHLRLTQSFGFKITRVRRGDIEFVPDENTKLEVGDRIRILSLKDNSDLVKGLFGDSMAALGDVDFLAIGLGIILGIGIGSIRLPLPGGIFLSLGMAGGPLLAGLVLSRIGRTGPIEWKTPDPAIRIINQIGLIFYSAYLGVQGGDMFWEALKNGSGLWTLFLSALLCLLVGLFCLFLACRVFQMKLNRALGVYCGLLTQPIVLDYVEGAAQNEMASAPFAALFPACLIVKIVLCQVLLYVLK